MHLDRFVGNLRSGWCRYVAASTAFLIALTVSQLAQALTGTAGVIGNVQIEGSGGGAPGNYDFRVFLTSNAVLCNGMTWAYINTTDANYNALVAAILSAKAQQAGVTIYYTQVGSYCQLTFIVLN